MSANMLREQKYECENMPKHPRSVRDAQYAKLKRSTKISGAPAPGRPMDPDPSDGSVDVSPAHSPCTEWPRKSRFPFFPSRAALVDRVSSRRARRSRAASSALRAARQSLQQSIPNVSPTATNRVSPRESSLCTSPTPNRCKRFDGFVQVDSWRRCFEQQITSLSIRWRSRSC
jgi:hypothetical protein